MKLLDTLTGRAGKRGLNRVERELSELREMKEAYRKNDLSKLIALRKSELRRSPS